MTVPWEGGDPLPARLVGEGGVAMLLAHGAGTTQDHPAMVALRDGLAAAGLTVMTFDYPYAAAGRRRPDPTPRLLSAHRAALHHLRERVGEPVVLAGRSMGGRMGTYLAAEGEAAAAVVCYAYPLHPAGRPDRLRADHLPRVGVPMLMVRGSGDALSQPELFDRHVRALPQVTVIDLEGADHGFRGKGWTPDGVAERLATETVGWLRHSLA